MLKKILYLLFLFLCFSGQAFAFKPETFVTISNPVRGFEGWSNTKQSPLDLPTFFYQEATHSGTPITWMLRFDALENATISGYFANLISTDKTQSLGGFLEITPSLVASVGLSYPPGFSIFNANRIFLSGYQDFERIKLIDKYMQTFFSRFGTYPKSISAWHLDSFSLDYLQRKYSVLAAMNCDDQFSMDHYRLWGGYVGSPYFPDKNNSLVPAKSQKERVNLAMVRWAPRDLYHFYGDGISSMYSFQINDYTGLGLGTSYFQNLLKQYSQKDFNEFTHFNIGLENDYHLATYKTEIKNVLQTLNSSMGKYNLRPILLADFGDWFLARYPESSPAYFYKTVDTLNQSKETVSWYQSPWYRLGLKSDQGQTKLLDLRVYNRQIYEDHFNTPNQNTSLFHEIPPTIDTVKYKDQSYLIDFDLSQSILVYNKYTDYWKATLVSGNKRLILYPDKISFSGITPPNINSQEIKVVSDGSTTTWIFTPSTPFKHQYQSLILWLLLFLILLYKFFKKPKPPIVGLFLSLIAGLTLYKSGTLNSFGLGFWGPNGHDAVFHLSLIEHFRQNPFSLSHPQFSGEVLKNYHFVFDYLLGILSRLTFTAPHTIYFLIFPICASLLLVYYLNLLLDKWKYSSLQKNLAFVFTFLGGSLGFIPRISMGQNLFTSESVFWANQSVSMFLNPPFVLSLIILLVFLNKFFEKGETDSSFITLSLLGGVLAQTKIYAFILLVAGLFLSKKYKLFFGVFIVGLIFTLPFASFSGSPFSFQPLWFLKSMFASPDRLYWFKLVQAWQTYEQAGPFSKLILINLFALSVFIIGNLGVRILGFLTKTSSLIKAITYLGILIPLLFTQSINPWNTIQFLYYSLFFLGILAAKFISKYQYLVVPLLLIGTLTSLGTLRDYLTHRSASRISYTELVGLNLLKGSAKGIVLSPIFTNNNVSSPKPQYAYVSSSYISALTSQPEFLSDTINLDITNIDYKNRANNVQRFYNTMDVVWAKQFLQKNNISYVYETPLKKLTLSASEIGLTPLFTSGEVNIYSVN